MAGSRKSVSCAAMKIRAIWQRVYRVVGRHRLAAIAAVKQAGGAASERRWLRPPLQSRQIRILSFGSITPRGFFGLTEGSSRFLLFALLLQRFLSIALG